MTYCGPFKRMQLLRQKRQAIARARGELREPSTPRRSAAGPMSPAVKVVDDATRALIDQALKERGMLA